ncbi:uncharacterized protein LOC117148486 [Drosophila mauritiana]|uniref:Uncharacterized protein LOC117148486 n=1 Tax=Drosophila mauritiana TaxID=7226 RepID=A0A6P8L0B8_DROMA|nr:uncharacterized protein LOC117148486 [Drosophila mauritiana]
MTKYFNTHILQSLVAELSAEYRDRYLNQSTAGRYVLYASSDPCKELHPRTVKKSLRNLFGRNESPNECVVRIREENFPKITEPLGLESAVDEMGKSEEGGLRMGTNSKSSTSIINLDQRARGGLNASYDPNMLFENEYQSNWTGESNSNFSRNPSILWIEKQIKSYTDAHHAQMQEKQVDLDEPSSAMNQMPFQEASSELSSEENDIPEQVIHLFDSWDNWWNQILRHDEPNPYVDCWEFLWNLLSYCMRIVRPFLLNRWEEPGRWLIRFYMDRAHYASFILGPATDEYIAVLADHIDTIIKWAMNKEVQPSEIADEPQ